jgi:ribosomal protein S18 acetylase RimI-like enzyme
MAHGISGAKDLCALSMPDAVVDAGCRHFAPERRVAATVNMPPATIARPYAATDFDELVARWHETNRVSYDYVAEHQRHTLADARAFFRDHVLDRCCVWVAQRSGHLCGMLALEAPWIRQLAVFPQAQRQGVGTLLLRSAREASPGELRLFTFKRNVAARAFYAKHGFAPLAFGISPAPESEPDVELRWVAENYIRSDATEDRPGPSSA